MKNASELARRFLETGRSPVPIIDAHTHMGANYGTHLPKADAAEMVEMMDAKHVECAFCAPHSALFDPSARNRELEEAMARYPGRFYGYFTYNPNYPALYDPYLSDVLRIPGYLGFKLLPGYHRMPLDGPAYAGVLAFAAEHGLLVLSHTWGGDPYNAPAHAERVLRRHPRLKLILGHSAPGEAAAAIRLAQVYENVYLDLCDIHRHNGIVDLFAAEAGAGKVLFGTDMPWYDPNYCLGSVLFSRITDAEKELILYGNAKNLITSL